MYTHVHRRFFPGTRLRDACDLMTGPRGSFLLLFWRRVLRAAQTPWEPVADARSLLRSCVCRRPSFSGIVPAPGDAQRELCPIPRAAVVDGGADFSFVQTVPPRDLFSLTVFRLLSDGRVVSVAWSKCGEEAEWTCTGPLGPVGTRPDVASMGVGKEGRRGVGADRGPAGITPENFPNAVALINLQIPEAERITVRENPERPGQGSL